MRPINAFANSQSWIKNQDPKLTTKSINTTNTITRILFEYGRIIMSDEDGVILVYSNEGKLKLRLQGHKHGVWTLATTRTKLVSGSEDKTIRIWNLLTGYCTHVFRGHTGVVRSVVIVHPQTPVDPKDDKSRPQPFRPLIVSGSRDGSVRVWMLPHTKEPEYGRTRKGAPLPDPDPNNNPYHLYHLTGHEGGVRCITADRKIILSGGEDCTVRAYDAKLGGKLLHCLRGHTQKITRVAIELRVKTWYSASYDGTVRRWSPVTGDCLTVCSSPHKAAITFMVLTNWRLCTAGEDGLAATRNAGTGEYTRSFKSGDGNYMVDFAADDYRLLTCTEKRARFWHPQYGHVVRVLYECAEGEKLSHVAYEWQQCAVTYKDARGINTLHIIDFRSPTEIGKKLYPGPDSIDSDEGGPDDPNYYMDWQLLRP